MRPVKGHCMPGYAIRMSLAAYDPEMLCMGDTEVDVDVANKVVAKCAEMNDITEDVKYGIVWKKGPKFFPPIVRLSNNLIDMNTAN
ncbi:unnamed protein product [Toxocara canis]|uniref:Phosphoglycolate phosphatase n=1 Tax=Toxocara canis TaxID=6265 RepID=A0A183UTN1_TOXCA|nr:unnamed protein product [Toxocara canis]